MADIILFIDDVFGIVGRLSRIVPTGQRDLVQLYYYPLGESIGQSLMKSIKGDIQYPIAVPRKNCVEKSLPGYGNVAGVPRVEFRVTANEKGESPHLDLMRGIVDDHVKKIHDLESEILTLKTDIGNKDAQLRGLKKNVEKEVQKAQEMAKTNNPWDAMNNRFNGGFNNRPSEFDQEE